MISARAAVFTVSMAIERAYHCPLNLLFVRFSWRNLYNTAIINLCVKGFLINNVENDCVVRITHTHRCARFLVAIRSACVSRHHALDMYPLVGDDVVDDWLRLQSYTTERPLSRLYGLVIGLEMKKGRKSGRWGGGKVKGWKGEKMAAPINL